MRPDKTAPENEHAFERTNVPRLAGRTNKRSEAVSPSILQQNARSTERTFVRAHRTNVRERQAARPSRPEHPFERTSVRTEQTFGGRLANIRSSAAERPFGRTSVRTLRSACPSRRTCVRANMRSGGVWVWPGVGCCEKSVTPKNAPNAGRPRGLSRPDDDEKSLYWIFRFFAAPAPGSAQYAPREGDLRSAIVTTAFSRGPARRPAQHRGAAQDVAEQGASAFAGSHGSSSARAMRRAKSARRPERRDYRTSRRAERGIFGLLALLSAEHLCYSLSTGFAKQGRSGTREAQRENGAERRGRRHSKPGCERSGIRGRGAGSDQSSERRGWRGTGLAEGPRGHATRWWQGARRKCQGDGNKESKPSERGT